MEGVKSEVLELLHSRNIFIKKSTKSETGLKDQFKIRRTRNCLIITRYPDNRNKSDLNLNEIVKLETNNHLCRVCLKEGSISIFEDNSTKDLAASLNTIGGLDICIFDPYPKFLCQICYKLLQSGILFRNTAQQSDNILKKSLRQTNANKEYTNSPEDKVNEMIDLEKCQKKPSNTEPDSIQLSAINNENKANYEIMFSDGNNVCQNEIKDTLEIKLEPETSYLYDNAGEEDNVKDDNVQEPTQIKLEPKTSYLYDNVGEDDNLVDVVQEPTTVEITLERISNNTEQEYTHNVEIPVECTLRDQQEETEKHNMSQNSENPKNTPKIHYKKNCTACGKKYGFRYAEGGNKLVCSNCFYKVLPEPSTELNVMPEQEQQDCSQVKMPNKVKLINPKPDISDLLKVTNVVSLVKKEEKHLDNEALSNSEESLSNSDWEYEPIKPSKTPNKKRQQKACKLCKVKFESTTEYDDHILSDEHIKRKTYCSICDKSFAPEYFRRHKRTHKVAKSHACETCGKSYMMPHELQRHRLTHTVTKEVITFNCSLCPYKGRFSDSLKNHMRIHTGEKPYVCQECPQRFINNSNLKKHMLIHKKPFRCQCDKRFCTRQQLELHFKSEHMGVKEHVCKICDKVYGYKHSLRKHERRVHKREKLRTEKLPIYLKADETKAQEST